MERSEDIKYKSIKYGEIICKAFNQWYALKNGIQEVVDPFYPEGSAMETCRNTIIRYKEKIVNELPEELYPEEYYLDTPEEYPHNYIAREDELLTLGEKRLKEIKQMPEYRKMLEYKYEKYYDKKIDKRNNIYYYAVKGYVENFEQALHSAENERNSRDSMKKSCYDFKQDIMDVRRYARYSDEWWKGAFERCLYLIKDLCSQEEEQENNSNEGIHLLADNYENGYQFSLLDFGLC